MSGLVEFKGDLYSYNGNGKDGTGVEGNLNKCNEQIRDYFKANNKILYDYADIESYDPDGNYFLDKGANDKIVEEYRQKWLDVLGQFG